MVADIFAELNQAIAGPPELPAPTTNVKVDPRIAKAFASGITKVPPPPPETEKVIGVEDFPEIPADFGTDAMIVEAPATPNAPAIIDRSERLEKLVDDALSKTQELLDIPLDPMDENFVKVASMQKDLVVSIINTGVKVDENRFKKRQSDALTGILSQLLTREKELIDLTPVGSA